MGDSSDSEEFFDAEEFTPIKGSKRSSICKSTGITESKDEAEKCSESLSTAISTSLQKPSDDHTIIKNVVQDRRRFQELRRCMQTEEEDEDCTPDSYAGSTELHTFNLEHPFKIIQNDAMSLQSMTSLGRIGRILSGASESHPNIREHITAATVCSKEPSTLSDEQLLLENRNQNVLAMAEPDVIASTKANSLKQSRGNASSIVTVSSGGTARPLSEGPIAPPRRKKRNKLYGSQSLSTTDGDNLSICTTDTDDYRPEPRRLDKQEKPPPLDNLCVEPTLSDILGPSQLMALPSPASTIESITREFQDSLELSQSKYTQKVKSSSSLNERKASAERLPRSESSSRSSTTVSVRSQNSAAQNVLDNKSSKASEYLTRPSVEERAAAGSTRTRSEGRPSVHTGHSSLGSSGRRGGSEGAGGQGTRSRRRSAGDEQQLNMRLRTRTKSGQQLSDLEILEQVTVLNLDTGERMPLSVAEHKLPQCINPLSLHIMRLTSEYIGDSGMGDNASHTFVFDPVPTLVFVPSPVLNFGSGFVFDSDSGSVLDSALQPAFNSDSVAITASISTNPGVSIKIKYCKFTEGSEVASSCSVARKPSSSWLKRFSVSTLYASTGDLDRRSRSRSVQRALSQIDISTSRNRLLTHLHRETDEESESVAAGGGAPRADPREPPDTHTNTIRKKTEKLKRFFGSTVKRTVDAARSLAQEVSHARHKEDVADIADDVRGEHNIKLKASNSHKGPYDFDGCVRHVQEMNKVHTGAVWCCKFSVCGRLLATAGQDKLLRIWVTRDAAHLFQDMRKKYNAELKSSPTPSQESLATLAAPPPASEDELPLGRSAPFCPKPFCVYSGHTSDLLDVSWSKNYFVLSSSMDKTVRLWHISRGECLCCFQHIDFVTAIVFHPRDDRYFLSGSLDGKLRLWNIPDKKVAVWNEVDGKTKLITAANFCQNGKFAVVGTYDGRCIFYTTDQLKYHTQIDVRSTRGKNSTGRKISGIEPMPNEDKVLVTSNDSRIRLYDLADLSLSCKYKGYVNVSSQIKASFSHDAKYIVSGSENQCIYIWKTYHDYSKFTSVRRDRNDYWEGIKAHNAVVTCAVFAPNPDHMIRTIAEREQESRRAEDADERDKDTVAESMVATSQTGHVLVSADFNGCIKVFVHKAKPKHSSLPASALA
ncbi:WD repeat-containing protein 44 [Eumeta japonica]|uniref:WD repeat-containing protein 44 n=1 Tax=Eumeta variegata TaxID=151549 RepID=A0A4C1VNM5_EUMVA|nr:WD repeat-containing protein 44 [Eumeta japonica]